MAKVAGPRGIVSGKHSGPCGERSIPELAYPAFGDWKENQRQVRRIAQELLHMLEGQRWSAGDELAFASHRRYPSRADSLIILQSGLTLHREYNFSELRRSRRQPPSAGIRPSS